MIKPISELIEKKRIFVANHISIVLNMKAAMTTSYAYACSTNDPHENMYVKL